MSKTKRINKTKEQIIADFKNNERFQEKMKFVREKFYPALCGATNSIDDATQNLAMINMVLMERFLGKMKEVMFKDMRIIDNLDPTDPQYERLKSMLELFDEMNVFDAKEIMEGMKQEIALFIVEENKNRPLSSLKTKWIDEL